MKRWSIYIDIEGFSSIYAVDEAQALTSIHTLIDGIYCIGKHYCLETPNRLFVHQTGDGFAIISELNEGYPQVPISMAIFLMQRILTIGGIAKAGISSGDFSDIRGCFRDIFDEEDLQDDGIIRIGKGVMRLFPCMGNALINANKLTTKKRGAILLMANSDVDFIPREILINRCTNQPDVITVDWVHTNTSIMRNIEKKLKIKLPEVSVMEKQLLEYINKYEISLKPEWIQNTINANRIG